MKQLFWNDTNAINLLEKVLKRGEIVLAEGDTVLGLLADISAHGYHALDVLKNRSHKPYLVLVSDMQKALNLIEKNDILLFQIEKLMKSYWPGPLTLLLKAKKNLPSYMVSDKGAIGIRVPDHQGLIQLLQKCEGLFSTSANKSGDLVPGCVDDVHDDIKQSVAYFVMNEKNGKPNDLPSTILDCTGEKIIVVREGALSSTQLMKELSTIGGHFVQ